MNREALSVNRRQKCVFVSRPLNIVSFPWKNGDLPELDVDFLQDNTFRKIMEIVEDFDEKSNNNNGKPWKSSRILRLKPNFFIFHFLFIFSFFFFSFFHFFIFSCFVFLFIFLYRSSCSFSFHHFFIFVDFSFFLIFLCVS